MYPVEGHSLHLILRAGLADSYATFSTGSATDADAAN